MNNSKAFFDAIRPAMGALSNETVAGIEALLDAGRDLPLHHMANVLAQVRRETGGAMFPIKETVMPWHKNKHPSDGVVIARLNAAWKKGQLKGVKAPYWQGGAFGRGQIQITHDHNYAKFGVKKYDDALALSVSARIAVEGMRDGKFTKFKMEDFTFPGDLVNPPSTNPRRIVNGNDGSDAEVAASHRMFAAALGLLEPVAPPPADYVIETPKSKHEARDVLTRPGFWASVFAAIFGKAK